MLKALKNKDVVEFESIKDLVSGYQKIIIDLGTGNGKFVIEGAKKEPLNFFIGIDPVADNISAYLRKKKKSLKLHGNENYIFVISSIEAIPEELFNIADEIHINFPWGSLLEGIVKGEYNLLTNIYKIANKAAEIQMTFTYSSIYEAGEIERRKLPELSLKYIDKSLREKFQEAGLNIIKYSNLEEQELKNFGTLWSKRIFLTKNRSVFHIACQPLN
ncbi:MAG: hypothetical protein L0Y48_00335 [Fusobacteria bacterium]|nr:hypothetical protein [Fusobacteriota bacterium]